MNENATDEEKSRNRKTIPLLKYINDSLERTQAFNEANPDFV